MVGWKKFVFIHLLALKSNCRWDVAWLHACARECARQAEMRSATAEGSFYTVFFLLYLVKLCCLVALCITCLLASSLFITYRSIFRYVVLVLSHTRVRSAWSVACTRIWAHSICLNLFLCVMHINKAHFRSYKYRSICLCDFVRIIFRTLCARGLCFQCNFFFARSMNASM